MKSFDRPKPEPSVDGGAVNYIGDSDVEMSVRKHVQFNLTSTTTHTVTPYSEIYGCHPRLLKTYKTGMQRVADHVDHFTSKSSRIMSKRQKQRRRGTNNDAHWYRLRMINEANAALTLVPLIAGLPTESDDMVLQLRSKT